MEKSATNRHAMTSHHTYSAQSAKGTEYVLSLTMLVLSFKVALFCLKLAFSFPDPVRTHSAVLECRHE